jgi:hypothetical protein
MNNVGRVQLAGPGPGCSAELHNAFRCVNDQCGRHFDQSIGYILPLGTPIRDQLTCDCDKMQPPVLAIVKVHEDRRTVTYACLRCGKTEDHEYSPCP